MHSSVKRSRIAALFIKHRVETHNFACAFALLTKSTLAIDAPTNAAACQDRAVDARVISFSSDDAPDIVDASSDSSSDSNARASSALFSIL